jgi:superoxide dismutase
MGLRGRCIERRRRAAAHPCARFGQRIGAGGVAHRRRGGSGWVLLSWSPRDGKLVNQWASDHCHTLAGGSPILALDMYEHSYHIDLGAKAATYVETFMEAIHWGNVRRTFRAASEISRAGA